MLSPPDYSTPTFHSFDAVKPRPKVQTIRFSSIATDDNIDNEPENIVQVNPYYDFEEVIDSDEELDLKAMESSTSVEDLTPI